MAVFLNSLGELTAYDHTGELLWQVGQQGPARCGGLRRCGDAPVLHPAQPPPAIKRGCCLCPPPLLSPLQQAVGATWREPLDEDQPAPQPTLRAMPLRPHAVPTAILAGAPLKGGRGKGGNKGGQLRAAAFQEGQEGKTKRQLAAAAVCSPCPRRAHNCPAPLPSPLLQPATTRRWW